MVTTDVNDIVSGQRSEFLVKGNAQPGIYQIWSPNSLCDLDEPATPRTIATLVVEGEPTDMDLPDDLPQPDYILPDTRAEEPDVFETTEFSGNATTTAVSALYLQGGTLEWTGTASDTSGA